MHGQTGGLGRYVRVQMLLSGERLSRFAGFRKGPGARLELLTRRSLLSFAVEGSLDGPG